MAADTKNAGPPYGQLEGEAIKPAIRRRLQVCYDHAQKLTTQKGKIDHNYAHDMLVQCAKNDPGNLVYVEAMLDNLQQKHGNNKKGGGSGGNRNAFKKAIKENDWAEILKAGPELLAANPWDKSVLEPMADACGVFGFNEVELRYLKNALDANLKDIAVNKHCAATLTRVGQFDQAIGCWRRIGEIRGKDTEVDNMISGLIQQKTRVLTGLGDDDKATGRVVNEQTSTSPAAKPAGSPSVGVTEGSAAPKKKQIQLTPRQVLEREIADNPDVVDNYVKLAQMLQDDGRIGEAVEELKKGLSVSGGDFRVLEKLEDAQVLQMKQQVAVADKRASVDGTDEAKQLAEDMREQLHRKELEIFSGRATRHPDDAQLQFELGVRLKKVGNFEEAEKTLMAARQDIKLKSIATIELGECLQQQKKYTNALQFYARAVELTQQEDDLNTRKLALYRAGTLAMGLKQYPVAETYLQTLSKIDARYRDVLSRLDKVKKMRHKG